MRTRVLKHTLYLALAGLVLPLAACATRGDRDSDERTAATITPAVDTLGEAVRVLGEQGTGIALLNGLEGRPVGEKLIAKLDAASAVPQLAKAAGCTVQQTPHYAFLYVDPARYEVLTAVSLQGRLDPAFRDLKADIGFGAGTKLFTAFAVMGHAFRRTFIVDNAIAETECGEIALSDAPIESTLEALLKSARVPAFNLDSTPEYVFVSGAEVPPGRDLLLNPDRLDPAGRALLDKRVNVFLPEQAQTATGVVISTGAQTLRYAVPTLSRQLGAPIHIQRGLEEFPVNPVVMHDVRLQTALDLLVRQWPLPNFGYEVSNGRILIRRR